MGEDGSASGKVLKTDSSGQLSWSDDTDTDNDTTYVWLHVSGGTATVSYAIDGTGWPDYDAATEAERMYAFAGLTGTNSLGVDKRPGNYIF